MHRRGACALAQRRGAKREQPPAFGGVNIRPDEQSRPRRRSEGHRALELGIVVAARSGVGVGPAVIEDVFALAVVLGVERHHRGDAAFRIGRR
jgi:hypothetical protein